MIKGKSLLYICVRITKKIIVMKKIVALFVIAFAWAGMHAQGFGVEAGLNFGSMKYESGSITMKFKSHMGFYAGVNYEYEVGENMYLHGGLAFSQYGGKYSKDGLSLTMTMNYIDIPFMFKYGFDLSDNIRGFAIGGLSIGMGLGGKEVASYDGDSDSADIIFTGTYDNNNSDKVQFKPLNMGLRFGAGLSFGQFEGGLYYTTGVSDISLDNDVATKTSLFSLILGYRFM